MCHLRGSNLQSLTGWEKVHKKLIKDPCASGQIFGIGCLRNYGTAVYHLNLLEDVYKRQVSDMTEYHSCLDFTLEVLL